MFNVADSSFLSDYAVRLSNYGFVERRVSDNVVIFYQPETQNADTPQAKLLCQDDYDWSTSSDSDSSSLYSSISSLPDLFIARQLSAESGLSSTFNSSFHHSEPVEYSSSFYHHHHPFDRSDSLSTPFFHPHHSSPPSLSGSYHSLSTLFCAQGEENTKRHTEDGNVVLVTEHRTLDSGNRKGHIVIRVSENSAFLFNVKSLRDLT